MKVRMRQLVEGKEALRKLFRADLPIKTAYRLGKIVRKIDAELQDYERLHNERVRKYGEEDQEKHIIQVKPENMEKFREEIQELLDMEVDLGNVQPINIEELDGVKLSAVDMAFLEPFLTMGKGDETN